MQFSCVVPIANERKTAIPFLHELLDQLDQFRDKNVFVVFDKSCTDGTIDKVRDLAAARTELKVIWDPEIDCVAGAYLRGYRQAIDAGADWILEIDAGYSHKPKNIGAFLAELDRNYDCIFGSRFCEGGRMERASWSRYIASRGGTYLTNLLLGTLQSDMTSGFQLLNRKAATGVMRIGLRSRGTFFQTEIKVFCRDLRLCEVPIQYVTHQPKLRRGSIRESLSILAILFFHRLRGKLEKVY